MRYAIDSFDFKHGISKKRNYLSQKRSYLKTLTSYNLMQHMYETSLEDVIEKMALLKKSRFRENEEFSFKYKFWDSHSIKQKMSALQKETLELEEEIEQIKARESIEVELFETSIELLGIS
ncbi:MAG: hypothetical protein ACLFOC_08965 [Campylobacterales bacterium]